MNTVTSILFLTSLFMSCHSKAVDPQPPSDLVAALNFIKCTQKAIIDGIPEANIPSHNPLVFAENFTLNPNIGNSSIVVHLDNVKMEGIPFWNVTQAAQQKSDDPNVDIFKFTIYWPLMSFSADWSAEAEVAGEDNSGTLYIELDHLNFILGWTSTKPTEGRDGTLDDLSLLITTEESQVKLTNLGILGDVINTLGGPALSYFVNNNPLTSEVVGQLKAKLINDWVNKPEKIEAITEYCNK